MEAYKIEIAVIKKTIVELTAVEKQWMDAALAAARNAYAPYSKFQVGAVVVLDNDQLVAGNNQENAAYPSGLCAERVALFAAGAQYPDVPIKAVVIAAIKEGIIQDKIAPCGACSQVLLESEIRHQQPVRILMYGSKEVRIVGSVSALLPFSFNAESLH